MRHEDKYRVKVSSLRGSERITIHTDITALWMGSGVGDQQRQQLNQEAIDTVTAAINRLKPQRRKESAWKR